MKSLSEAKLLVVDDDEAILEVLGEWFTLFGCQVDTASDGLAALSLAKLGGYDVVITDLQMPSLNGHQLLSLFHAHLDPAPAVIVLSGQGTMEDAIAVLREGRAFDFLLKPIRDFQQLNAVIEKALARHARPAPGRAEPKPAELPAHVEVLSPRELEIIAMLGQGLENAAIADRLCLSEKTVKNNLTRIYEKLKVENRTQAVVSCQEYGLI